jgi:hypothetical protein
MRSTCAKTRSAMTKEFDKSFVEKEPTCPGGGKMRYRVFVDEPLTQWDGAWKPLNSMIGLEEGSTAHDVKDALLLDLEAARWLYRTLGEAIERASLAEEQAKLQAEGK